MNLKRRLVFYALGLGIGCMAVAAFFPGVNWLSWLPSNTIKRHITEVPVVLNMQSSCIVNCLNISEDHLMEIIKEGEVMYDKSETKVKPRKYHIALKDEYVYVAMGDKTSVIERYGNSAPTTACDCP